jgi:hypothetical protein
MDWQKFSSIAALAVSVTSFAPSYSLSVKNASSVKNATASVQPIWVFHYNRERGWSVRNVGNGPALDVLTARRTDDQSDSTYPVRIAPVSKDGEFALKWVEHSNVRTLNTRYADVHGDQYSSTCMATYLGCTAGITLSTGRMRFSNTGGLINRRMRLLE